MKWITPLWSNPVGWAEVVAKTRLRVVVWTFVHVLFISGGLLSIYWLMQKTPSELNLGWIPVMMGAFPIVFIGIAYPAMYLYAMHRLLKIVREPATGK